MRNLKFVLSYKFRELLIYHVVPNSGPEKFISLAKLLINRVLIYRDSTVYLNLEIFFFILTKRVFHFGNNGSLLFGEKQISISTNGKCGI